MGSCLEDIRRKFRLWGVLCIPWCYMMMMVND